jgi:hypothetical protein
VLSGNVPGTVRAYVVVMREAQPAAAPVPVTTEVAARRFRAAAAAALVVLAVLLAAASVPLYAMTHQNVLVNGGQNIAVAVLFSAVGLVVIRRQPRNAIGWILLTAPAGLQLLPADAASYALLAYRLGHRLPFGAVALLLEYSWAPASVLLGLAILLFPDGRLPSPRWRPVLWSYLAVVGCYVGGTYAVAATAVAARHVRVDSGGGLTAISSATFYWLVFPVLAAFLLSFVAAQVLSWRRSSGERRQQLKWLMSGAAVLAASQVMFQPILALYPHLPQVQLVLGFLVGLGAAALPASMAVAILKYRLYDIDRIISRTLSYAIVTGLLIAVYTGLVLLATQGFQFRTPVAVAAATLTAAALFNPLRRRVQRAVDRRFNRARYDADKTVAAFAARLKDAVDLDAVQADLATAVQQTLEPAHISVWMSERRNAGKGA